MSGFKKSSKVITLLCAGLLTVGMIAQPKICIESARNAIELCMSTVIPSLFPFFICSGLFISLGLAYAASRFLSPVMRPLFGVSGSGALAFVLGIVSGYPVGARCAADLYQSGECTKTEAERLLAFCNNSGPLFVIGAVGAGMLQNPQIGRMLYVSHLLSALLTGMIFKFYGRENLSSCALPPRRPESIRSAGGALGEVIANSVDTMLKVCAFVIVFSVIGGLLPQQLPARGFVYGILEITSGIKAWVSSSQGNLTLPFISFFLAFSGISVLLQVSSIVTQGGLSVKPYIMGKTLQGILSFGITALMLKLIPSDAPVFSNGLIPLQTATLTPRGAFMLTLMMIGWSLISILLLCALGWLYEFAEKRKNR